MIATGLSAPRQRAPRLMLRLSPLWLLALWLGAGGVGAAAETNAASARLTVAVLTFEDATGDPGAAHWRYLIERLLTEQVGEAKALRRVPAAFGYRQLKVKRGDPISVEQAGALRAPDGLRRAGVGH